MIDFTILFNSRGRFPLLQDCLYHIDFHSYEKKALEVLVNFDDDDLEAKEFRKELKEKFPFFKPSFSPREENIHINVNKMAFQAQGKYIWAIGDDCNIKTKEWDRIVKKKIEKYLG